MNYAQLRSDIESNLDKLPEKFADSVFYDPPKQCMCFYGWLASTVGGIDVARIYGDLSNNYDTIPIWDFLEQRYGIHHGGELIRADEIIRGYLGEPGLVADAMLRLASHG